MTKTPVQPKYCRVRTFRSRVGREYVLNLGPPHRLPMCLEISCFVDERLHVLAPDHETNVWRSEAFMYSQDMLCDKRTQETNELAASNTNSLDPTSLNKLPHDILTFQLPTTISHLRFSIWEHHHKIHKLTVKAGAFSVPGVVLRNGPAVCYPRRNNSSVLAANSPCDDRTVQKRRRPAAGQGTIGSNLGSQRCGGAATDWL